MKSRIPQFELPIPEEPLALVTESTSDGDRITASRIEAERDRTISGRLQSTFGSVMAPPNLKATSSVNHPLGLFGEQTCFND